MLHVLCIYLISTGQSSDFPHSEYIKDIDTSKFHNASHKRLRQAVRSFVEEHVAIVAEASERGDVPPTQDLLERIGRAGIFAAWVGPGKHLRLVNELPGGVKPSEFNYSPKLHQIHRV